MPSSVLLGLSILLLLPRAVSSDQEFIIKNEDLVAIRADQAWEDIEPDTIHFTGNFEMRIREMMLNADRADLYGKLENPDRLVLKGSPAHFLLSPDQDTRTETIEAEAQEIVYERESELIYLNGAARLAQGDNSLNSRSIQYNIKTDRFRTESQTNVQIKMHYED